MVTALLYSTNANIAHPSYCDLLKVGSKIVLIKANDQICQGYKVELKKIIAVALRVHVRAILSSSFVLEDIFLFCSSSV